MSFRYSSSEHQFGLKPTVLTLNRHMAEVLAHLGRGVLLFQLNTGLKREPQIADSPRFSFLRYSGPIA